MSSARLTRGVPPGLQTATVKESVFDGSEIPKGPLSSNDFNIPYIPQEILEHLQVIFKVQVRPEYDIRQYDRMVGQQEVLAYLSRLITDQDTQNK